MTPASPLDVRHLEMHLTHACNLACESCSHYSNQGHRGVVSLEEAERWLAPWSGRLAPHTFSMLGGEPSTHPQLPAFVELCRRHWPKAHLRLVSNGFFLHRHPDLPKVLQRDPDACLYLSIHHDSPEYRQRLEPILELLDRWVRDYGIRVHHYESWRHWTRRYTGEGAAMEPFDDGDPRQSWEHCPARYCPQVFEGRLWKCGPLAYLQLQERRYGLSPSWEAYRRYRPLEAGCSDAELAAFFAREEESVCGLCPANPERFELPMPLPALARKRDAVAAP